MKKGEKIGKNDVFQDIHTVDLPLLSLLRCRQVSDFEIERIHLESKGWNIQECKDGLSFLLDRLRELEAKDVER